jgi:hypothetical protein
VSEQKQSNAASILSVLGALILWGSSFVAIKFAYTTYSPLTLAVVRFIVATVILGGLTLLPKNRVKLQKKDIFTVAICGFYWHHALRRAAKHRDAVDVCFQRNADHRVVTDHYAIDGKHHL